MECQSLLAHRSCFTVKSKVKVGGWVGGGGGGGGGECGHGAHGAHAMAGYNLNVNAGCMSS